MGPDRWAIYRCCKCKHERSYGTDRPEDVTFQPMLYCPRCSGYQQHEFKYMDYDRHETEGLTASRVQKGISVQQRRVAHLRKEYG